MSISKQPFGKLPDGRDAILYTLRNVNGFSVSISDFGATLVSLLAPDRGGRLTDILCGYESADVYAQAEGYLGATVLHAVALNWMVWCTTSCMSMTETIIFMVVRSDTRTACGR